jgi:hypothetical protein
MPRTDAALLVLAALAGCGSGCDGERAAKTTAPRPVDVAQTGAAVPAP